MPYLRRSAPGSSAPSALADDYEFYEAYGADPAAVLSAGRRATPTPRRCGTASPWWPRCRCFTSARIADAAAAGPDAARGQAGRPRARARSYAALAARALRAGRVAPHRRVALAAHRPRLSRRRQGRSARRARAGRGRAGVRRGGDDRAAVRPGVPARARRSGRARPVRVDDRRRGGPERGARGAARRGRRGGAGARSRAGLGRRSAARPHPRARPVSGRVPAVRADRRPRPVPAARPRPAPPRAWADRSPRALQGGGAATDGQLRPSRAVIERAAALNGARPTADIVLRRKKGRSLEERGSRDRPIRAGLRSGRRTHVIARAGGRARRRRSIDRRSARRVGVRPLRVRSREPHPRGRGGVGAGAEGGRPRLGRHRGQSRRAAGLPARHRDGDRGELRGRRSLHRCSRPGPDGGVGRARDARRAAGFRGRGDRLSHADREACQAALRRRGLRARHAARGPAAVAVRNARLFRLQQEQNRYLASLLDSSRALTSTVTLEDS